MYSNLLYEKANQFIPGGVNSPVRAFKGVGGTPIFFEKGEGAYLYDVDGKSYIDYVGSWGPLILGHCHKNVVAAVMKALQKGMSFGAPTELEIMLAQKIVDLLPSVEKVRMVNSGTEATMTAIRLARAYTNRNKIIKFNGCYHGHSDALLVKAGSGLLTLGIPSTKGVPLHAVEHTLTADFNDKHAVELLFQKYGDDIAAVIVEPVAGNMGMVLPQPDFLPGLKYLCDKYQSLLIFDEVMTGFRVALGGAQAVYAIEPHLTTLGKIIGGGMPVGALGGKAEIMDHLAPVGDVYQAGTLSGNPLAMAAGLATLEEITSLHFYEALSEQTSLLIEGFRLLAQEFSLPFQGVSLGGMFGFCFSDQEKITSYKDVAASNEKLFRHFYQGMLQRGVYFAPSLFEAGFMSSVHGKKEREMTLQAAREVFSTLTSYE